MTLSVDVIIDIQAGRWQHYICFNVAHFSTLTTVLSATTVSVNNTMLAA